MPMPTVLNFRTLDLNLLRVFDVVMAEHNLTRGGQAGDHPTGRQQRAEAAERVDR